VLLGTSLPSKISHGFGCKDQGRKNSSITKSGNLMSLKKYSGELADAITSMFTLNVSKRPDSKDFLSHSRIRNVIKEQELNEMYILNLL
jgi:hypothetical protein